MPKAEEIRATIIVCAYNAETRIFETIRHLCLQKFSGGGPDFEILIVDNASTDRTQDVIRDAFAKHNRNAISWRVVEEEKAGLAHARRKGIQEATGEVVVFVDDDNSLDVEYVSRAIAVMERNSKVGVLGGANAPRFEVQAPTWFYSYAPFFAVGVQALRTGDVTSRGFVWGAGMILRRHVLEEFFRSGGELVLTGRTKTEALSGDDSEICKLYLLCGYELAYDENLMLSHYMPAKRLTIETLDRMLSEGEISVAVLRLYEALLIIHPSEYRARIGMAARGRIISVGLAALTKMDFSMVRRVFRNARLARRVGRR